MYRAALRCPMLASTDVLAWLKLPWIYGCCRVCDSWSLLLLLLLLLLVLLVQDLLLLMKVLLLFPVICSIYCVRPHNSAGAGNASDLRASTATECVMELTCGCMKPTHTDVGLYKARNHAATGPGADHQ